MNDGDLSIVLAALKRKHPDLMAAVRRLCRVTDASDAAAATTILHGLLSIFDEGEQAKWQLRDLLKATPKHGYEPEGDYYWAFKYNSTEMVYRIASAGGLDITKTTWFSDRYTPTLTSWKNPDLPPTDG